MSTMALRRMLTLSLLVVSACGGSSPEPRPARPPSDVEEPTPKPPTDSAPDVPEPPIAQPPIAQPPIAEPPLDDWSSLSLPATPPTTPDGIPILEVSLPAGSLWDVTPAWHTLTYAQRQASDGVSTFIAVREDEGTFSDVVIRGSEVRTNVLRRLAKAETHLGGCGAAHDGTLMVSAPVPGTDPEAPPVQAVWTVQTDGSVTRTTLPVDAGSSAACKAALDSPQRFSVFVGLWVEHDAGGFRIDRHWDAGRTFLAGPLGPRYCFRNCNEHEKAGTPTSLVTALEKALGDCYARYAVYGDLVVARCRETKTVVRAHVSSGQVEVMPGLPSTNHSIDGVQLTRDGHVVIELALHMSRYMVWPAGSDAPSPWRSRELGEVLTQTTPIVLIRGLPDPMPRRNVSAVHLGTPLPFDDLQGLSRGRQLDRGLPARDARSTRATAVLPPGPVVVTDDAAVHLPCGAYVRAPIGYEGEPPADDFDPPVMPSLSPRSVYTPSPCLPLAEVHALPGAPNFLLARTEDGQLATAWLPLPIPIPSNDRRYDPTPPAPTPVIEPRPGPGWVLHGAIDSIEGAEGLPAPGKRLSPMTGWQRGGAAVLKVDDATLIVTPDGVWTVPEGTTPMAVQIDPTPRLYGALGSKLVICDDACRTVDPGDDRDIIGVMPRTNEEVLLGFGETRDQTAVYRLPSTGTTTPSHALEVTLETQLSAWPKPPE